MPNLHSFDTTDQLASEVARMTIDTLMEILRSRGAAIWILAGGTSPLAAYRYIAEHYSAALDWSKVTIILGDERMVAPDRPDSNWRQIREALFVNNAFNQAHQILPDTSMPADMTARVYEEKVREELHRIGPKATIAWLGMGEDGHTLSLFPGHPDSRPTESLVVPVYNSPKPPSERISLTANALTGVRVAFVFATGQAKQHALQRALREGDLPIAQVAHHVKSNGGMAHWFVDRDAYPSAM